MQEAFKRSSWLVWTAWYLRPTVLLLVDLSEDRSTDALVCSNLHLPCRLKANVLQRCLLLHAGGRASLPQEVRGCIIACLLQFKEVAT